MQQCFRERIPIPEAIKNAPDLWIGLELFYDAFFDLDTCRNSGFTQSEISWFSIREYCEKLRLDEEQTERMHILIPLMDREFLKFVMSRKEGSKRNKG